MVLPVSVIASNRPTADTFRHLPEPNATVIASRTFALLPPSIDFIAEGRFIVSEPEVYVPTPGCRCCEVREDLVGTLVRATRRRKRPERLAVLVDLRHDDVLTAIATILSSSEIRARCWLDAVVVEADAVELATRLATHGDLAGDGLTSAVAIADRIVVNGHDKITPAARQMIHATLEARAGFARPVGFDVRPDAGACLDAWYGAPEARAVDPGRLDDPATIVLRVEDPLDADAIDDWLDTLIDRHAMDLMRVQGELWVLGEDERTCCVGIRSFACSKSERDHPGRRSTTSVLAICGVGLDAEELTASFRATVAT